MTIATDRLNRYRGIAHRVRAIPGLHGLRPYRVTVVIRSWSGARIGEGAYTDQEHELLESGQPPKVRFVADEERMLASLPSGSIDVGPVTPECSAGGVTWDTMTAGSAAPGNEVLYRITGPEFPAGALYVRSEAHSDRAIHYELRLVPRGT